MLRGLDPEQLFSTSPRNMTWEFARRVRDQTTMPFLIKGIVTAEDTHLAVEHGIDGVVVSNHGGRAEESGRATIDSLPEVVAAASGRIPVLVDGGFRRGTDVFTALALGARAVLIGRPYLWGLAAFGEPGVAKVLDVLSSELRMVMRQAGTTPNCEHPSRARRPSLVASRQGLSSAAGTPRLRGPARRVYYMTGRRSAAP